MNLSFFGSCAFQKYSTYIKILAPWHLVKKLGAKKIYYYESLFLSDT
jgi:hypothetical protein